MVKTVPDEKIKANIHESIPESNWTKTTLNHNDKNLKSKELAGRVMSAKTDEEKNQIINVMSEDLASRELKALRI